MKAKHVAWAVGGSLAIWAFLRKRKADAAGVPLELAFWYWSKPIPEVSAIFAAEIKKLVATESVDPQQW
jgi:hypothetical protein